MLNNDSYVIRKEACPECRSIGNDKSGDNLAVYSDGHCFCYRCGYITGRKSFTRTEQPQSQRIILPADVTTELPFEARTWLGQYQLARLDLNRNHVMWSEKWSRIIFPYFNETELLAWQGRYIGKELTSYQGQNSKPAKWFSQGKIHEIIHPVQVTKRKAVLVEDIVSAIKVSRHMGAIPIFGSSISTKQILRLKTICDILYVWLDKDIQQKAVKLSHTIELLGIQSRTIITDLDPKLVEHEEIERILTEKKCS